MTRIERMEGDLKGARAKLLSAMRRGDYNAIKAMKVKVHELEIKIRECDDARIMSLREALPKERLREEKIAENIAAIHLLIDALVDTAMDLRLKLRKYGLESAIIYNQVHSLEKSASKILEDVCNLGVSGLTRLIVENDELMDELKERVYSYIDKRMSEG